MSKNSDWGRGPWDVQQVAQLAAQVKQAVDPAELVGAIEKYVDTYVDGYALDDGECRHEPTDHERLLIADAINGLIADDGFMKLLRRFASK